MVNLLFYICAYSLVFLMTWRHPKSSSTDTLVPYTMLFRSRRECELAVHRRCDLHHAARRVREGRLHLRTARRLQIGSSVTPPLEEFILWQCQLVGVATTNR